MDAPREAVVVRPDEQLVRSGERGQREREGVHGSCGWVLTGRFSSTACDGGSTATNDDKCEVTLIRQARLGCQKYCMKSVKTRGNRREHRVRRSVLGRVSSPPSSTNSTSEAPDFFDCAGSQLVGQPFTLVRSRTSGTGNAQRTSMVRITEVDAHGHEIETKEEPKSRQLVNLSPADAKAVADHERKADSLIEKDRLHQAHAPLVRSHFYKEERARL